MAFDPRRLRLGEWIVGGGAAVLAVALFALPWYGVKSPVAQTAASLGGQTSHTGWESLSHVRWLVLITILVGLALAWLQGTRPSPAWPVTFSVIVTVFALLTTLALIRRVLIDVPGHGLFEVRAGSYLGLAAAVAMLYGGYKSMRKEGISERDAPGDIETVPLTAGTPDASADS